MGLEKAVCIQIGNGLGLTGSLDSKVEGESSESGGEEGRCEVMSFGPVQEFMGGWPCHAMFQT